jgi:hypothetical protein
VIAYRATLDVPRELVQFVAEAHTHGGNIQAVTAPDGFPLWISEAEPGYIT